MSFERPTISVIVPVYKVEPYLRECIDSILAQTYTDFELILVDDGSPDNCGKICDEYAEKDARIIVIHQENQGLSAARNAGLDVMRGEYVAFVDSDDLIHTRFLELHYETIVDYQAEVTKSFPFLFEKMDAILAEKQENSEARLVSGKDACYELYDPNGWFYTVWGKLFCANIFGGLRFPTGLIHEDEAVNYKIYYSAKKVVEIKQKLYFYRQNPESIMHQSFSVKRYDKLKVFLERYQFFLDRNEQELALMAKRIIDIYMAKYAIKSRKCGIYDIVEPQFKMSIGAALRSIKNNCSEQNYEWWLNEVHPWLYYGHLYMKKVKSLFAK